MRGNRHLEANGQCEHRAIAILQTVATTFITPIDKEEVGHCRGRLFFKLALSTKMSQMGHYETICILGMCIGNVVQE
jgi:hypothetical protein